MTVPAVAAVLVNYNAGNELRRALQSVKDELGGSPWEAAIVDNASSDGSAESVADFDPNARVICNAQNRGFARGVNQGVAATTAPLVLIMNPDCRLMAGALGTLRDALDTYPACAIAGPSPSANNVASMSDRMAVSSCDSGLP